MYQLFGSASSMDLDVVFYVTKIPHIKEAADQCKGLAFELGCTLKTNKKINANIAVLGDGAVLAVHKGTADELNNALFHTYSLHAQPYPLQIARLLPRDVGLKMLRCARKILSFFSRTEIRIQVKTALRGNFKAQISVLESLNLVQFTDLERKGSLVEFRKAAAFQLGQTLGLLAGEEFYSKEAIADYFPALRPSLMREKTATNGDLQPFLDRFIGLAKGRMTTLGHLKH